MRQIIKKNKQLSGIEPEIKSPSKTKTFNIKSEYIQYFIIVLFATCIGIGMFYHEMWRDELNIYARTAFTKHLLIEGDVGFIVYHSLLKVFMFISKSERMYQFFHFITIVAASFLFIRYASISNMQKLLFAFSYFIVYDYGIISRYYGFMILLIFIIVLLITQKRPKLILIVIFLMILANHSIQSTIFAASLSLYFILDTTNRYIQRKITINHSFLIAAGLFIIGWSVILLSHYFFTYKNAFYIGEGQFGSAPFFMNIKSIWNAFFPIPDPKAGVGFWNTNIVNYIMIYPKEYNISDFMTFLNVLTFLISLLIIIIISIKFSSKPTVLITFLFNTIIYLVFLKLLKVYFLRYQGLLFIIFMYSYFLYSNSEENYKISHFKKITDFLKTKPVTNLGKLFTPLLYIILIAQVYSAVYALSKDINFKFTLSQDAAKYIMDNNLQVTHTMVGYIDHTIESIAAHVQTKIFFPQSNSFSFYHEAFNKDRKAEMPIKEVFALCRKITEEQNKKVLLILDLPLSRQFIINTALSGKSSIKLIKAFSGEIIQPDEQYFLYEVEKI